MTRIFRARQNRTRRQTGDIMAEKKKHLVEITYSESKDVEVVTLNTDDLAWSMNQYQEK